MLHLVGNISKGILHDSFLQPRCYVFTARYGLHIYVNFRIIYFFKMLTMGTGLCASRQSAVLPMKEPSVSFDKIYFFPCQESNTGRSTRSLMY
jgi:hypothetical protein